MSVSIKGILILSAGLGWLLTPKMGLALCPDLGSFYSRLEEADASEESVGISQSRCI